MIQDELRDILLQIPSAKLCSGGKELVLRCRYCEDSKNPNHAHMYINLGYNDTPLFFNCFKCHTSGIVTHDKLLSWGLNVDINSMSKLITYNKSVLSLDKNRKYKNNDMVYRLNNYYISNNKLSEVKLKYINKRLGLDLTYNDLLENKIVLNLSDLLNSNNIYKYTRHENIMKELDEYFIGFISYDNAFINMRNLVSDSNKTYINKRYVNYSIFEKFDNTMKFYILPNSINLFNPNRIKIHIAEGPFDVLSIYYNLRKTKEHNIYAAITGSGYVNMCKHFINTMKLINVEFHLYPDADVNKNRLFNSLQIFKDVFDIPIYIHTNIYNGEKDFGVPLSRIKEEIRKL